ncbi:MAG: UDP-N-acetylmuramate--L-alanine ligase [Acidobacteria bacterium]|nr:MAG: UDP-N-acetylmuramate--L-alanine ligase [Acidobacteriota bacterium]
MRFGRARHLHMVGIGGSGMSGIAEVLLNLRYTVTGSDMAAGEAVSHLRSLGGTIYLGHAADHVAGADVVITSTAIRPDNPEVIEARRRGIPVIPRAEMLGELMRMKSGIAVAGTHGKTSVTSMVAQVLHLAGLDPTIVIGGRLGILGSSAKLGSGDFMVTEADESDGSFLMLRPKIGIITNIDREHLDYYGSMEALVDAFTTFANTVPFYGQVIACGDCATVREMLPRLTRRVVTYGLGEDVDLRATDLEFTGPCSRFRVHTRSGELGQVEIRSPGRHQVVNALAAVAAGLDCDVPFAAIADALGSFAGADRRFQIKGETNGILVVDDYGHHPTEIIATLAAARAGWDRRIIAVFQPHRFTRVQDLFLDFARAFDDAAVVVVTDIYAAGETPIPGIDAGAMATALRDAGHPDVRLVPDLDQVPATLEEIAREGDLVLTLGAGSVTRTGDAFLERLRQRAEV